MSKLIIDKGHEVDVFAPPPHYRKNVDVKTVVSSFRAASRAELGPAGEVIHRTPFVPTGESLVTRAFGQAVIALGQVGSLVAKVRTLKRADLIIGTVPALPTAVVTYLVARILRKPYIIDLRDAWPDLLREYRSWNDAIGQERSLGKKAFYFGLSSLLSVVATILRFVIKRAAVITVTSQHLGDHIEENLLKGIAVGRRPEVITIRNVFPSYFLRKELAASLDAKKELNVLYAGTIGRAQKLKNAVLASRICKDKGYIINLRFVGGGAALESLKSFAREQDINVTFESSVGLSALASVYNWADTALVHLADWESFDRTVPSKTYELMSAGVHISGAVSGEASDLIERLCAGHVVGPECPKELAELWIRLMDNPRKLIVSTEGLDWVVNERTVVVPQLIEGLLSRSEV